MTRTCTRTEQEAAWMQAREDVYARVLRDSSEPIRNDTILRVRENFVSDGREFVPKTYSPPSEADAVHSVCVAIPEPFAAVCRQIGEELAALVPRDSAAGHARTYVNDERSMHITLFHTSHEDDLTPYARERQQQDIVHIRSMASCFTPFPLKPRQLVLGSSGAIILLFDALTGAGADPFTVDRLRETAEQDFGPFRRENPKGIIHTTIARLLSPDIPVEIIQSLRQRCEELTEDLHREQEPIVIENLWFIDVTHPYWPKGTTTVIPLGGATE